MANPSNGLRDKCYHNVDSVDQSNAIVYSDLVLHYNCR